MATAIFKNLSNVLFRTLLILLCGTVVGQFELRIVRDGMAVIISCTCSTTAVCTVTPPVTFKMMFFNDSVDSVVVDDVMYRIKSLTPMTERNVSCASNNMFSDVVTIAAQPTVPPTVSRPVDVIGVQNMPLKLDCPFELGEAQHIIMPYEYSWHQTSPHIPNRIINETTKTLETLVDSNSPTDYYCAVYMRLCSKCSVNTLPNTEERVWFNVTKIDRVSVEISPMRQTVSENLPATFTCSANGSFIQISWMYGDRVVSSDDSTFEVNDVSTMTSSLTVLQATSNNTVQCVVTHEFDEKFINSDYVKTLIDPTMSASAFLIVITEASTTMETNTSPEVTGMHTGAGETITAVSVLGVVAILAVAVVISILCVMYCHYNYKYKSESSKIGRFLSRAMSKPPALQLTSREEMNQLPSDGHGCVPESFFQSAQSINRSISHSHEQEQIYNTSQHSNASGGSYSGLSGVSNQVPGMSYQMPDYAATEVSGASFCQSSSVTNGGLLAPGSALNRSPRHSGVGRSTRISNNSELTQEMLNQHQQHSTNTSDLRLFGVTPIFEKFPDTSNSKSGSAEPFLVKLPLGIHPDNPFPSESSVPHGQKAPFPHEQVVPTNNIPKATIETVMNCLMHNRNCLIPNCPCYDVRKMYQQTKVAKQHGRPTSLFNKQQSRSCSGSDSNSVKRSKLFLPLSSQDDERIHPHYHPGTRARSKSIYFHAQLSRRRSKSLDLTPVGNQDFSMCVSPVVGGSPFPETPVCAPKIFDNHINNRTRDHKQPESSEGKPRFNFPDTKLPRFLSPSDPSTQVDKLPSYVRSDSISADNIPTLCLNDCPFVLKPTAGNPSLPTVSEAIHLPSDMAPVSSNNANGSCSDLSQPQKRDTSIVQKTPPSAATNSQMSDASLISLKPYTQRSFSGSNNSLRSPSPAYQTVVSVSDNGSTTHMTEC